MNSNNIYQIKLYVVKLALLLTPLLGYTEWGNNSAFIGEMEFEVLTNSKNIVSNFTHPLILLPFLAQIIIIIDILKPQKKWLINSSIIAISIVMFLFLFIGIIDLNLKISASTLPFWISLYFYRKLLIHRN